MDDSLGFKDKIATLSCANKSEKKTITRGANGSPCPILGHAICILNMSCSCLVHCDTIKPSKFKIAIEVLHKKFEIGATKPKALKEEWRGAMDCFFAL